MNKKKIIIILSITISLIILIGSAYAFFTYFKRANALILSSNGINATFTSGSNQINFTNAYPISDDYAINNINKLDYLDFTISGNALKNDEMVGYEIFLTEIDGNTLNSSYIKVYLTDNNNNPITQPVTYDSLSFTTYANEPFGKVVYKTKTKGEVKNYRLYMWLDSTYEQNSSVQTFNFCVNFYAYNDNTVINVNFDPNEGTVNILNKEVIIGNTYGELPTPTRTGYKFNGWSLIKDIYKQVEYLESNGAQAISTGINASNNIHAVIDVEYTSPSSVSQILIGSGANSGQWIGQKNNYYGFGTSTEIEADIRSNMRKILDIVFDANGVTLKVDNFSVSRSGNHATGAYYTLFSSPYTGSPFYSYARIYDMKIYDNNENLIRYFIPCYRISDNQGGLYDLVEKVFYSNIRNGDFTTGEIDMINNDTLVTNTNPHTLYAIWEEN